MRKIITLLLFLLVTKASFGQKPIDTMIYHLTTMNGKLIYMGNAEVKGRSRAQLDSVATKWMSGYFKNDQPNAAQLPLMTISHDTAGVVLSHGILEFKVRPGMINIAYCAIINLKVACTDGRYNYLVDSISFRPKNNTLNAIGYQHDPNYLISVFKREHLGLATAMNVTRNQIRDYIGKLNTAILACIGSLNKAMAN